MSRIFRYEPKVSRRLRQSTRVMGLQGALTRWQRSSELTADRAGLLACQSQDPALRSMMKLAGLPCATLRAPSICT